MYHLKQNHWSEPINRTLKDVTLLQLQDLKSNPNVHVLIHAGVIVNEGLGIASLDEEVVVHPRMANIVDGTGQNNAELL